MDRAELKARARAQLGGGIFQNLWMMGLAVCLLIGLMESAAAGILPGIGALIVDRIAYKDEPVIIAGTIVISITFTAIMLLVDIIYAFVDPHQGQVHPC